MNDKVVMLKAAYGREYDSPYKAARDYADGKDFIIVDPTSRWNLKPASRVELEAYYGIIMYDDVGLGPVTMWTDSGGMLIEPSIAETPGEDRAFEDGDPCPDCGEPLVEMCGMVGCMQGMGCKLDPMG